MPGAAPIVTIYAIELSGDNSSRWP